MPGTPFVLDTCPLTAESAKIAEVELNETPERIEHSVEQLRQLLHENSDLHFSDDEQVLKIFLRPCHYYPESAIKLVSHSHVHRIFNFSRIVCDGIGFFVCVFLLFLYDDNFQGCFQCEARNTKLYISCEK